MNSNGGYGLTKDEKSMAMTRITEPRATQELQNKNKPHRGKLVLELR